MLGELFGGLLGELLKSVGGWAWRTLRVKDLGDRGQAIAHWLDTYELAAGTQVRIPLALGFGEDQIAGWLRAHETRGVLHEMIVVRLSSAPPTELDQARVSLRYACADYFAEVEQERAFELADAVFYGIDRELVELVGRLEESDPAVVQSVRLAAGHGRLAALLRTIAQHGKASETTPMDRVREREYLQRYRRIAANEYGHLEPPDFERRTRIPLADLYVAPQISNEDRRKVDLWDFGRNLDRTVLLGDPGGGKSTAVAALANALCEEPQGQVPLLVILREFAREDPPRQSIVGYLESRLENHHQCRPPAGLVERLLRTGKATVFFDGLDELIDTGRRRSVSQLVENFCESYPLVPVLVTSRRIGYDQARLDESTFRTFELAPFDPKRTAEYAAKWFRIGRYTRSGEDPQRWAEAFLEESGNVPDLRANPLMLALMCILYRGEGSLPRNRPAIYERCATLLFENWDTNRRIHVELNVGLSIEPMLRHLAYWQFTRTGADTSVTEAELLDQARDYLHGRRFDDPDEALAAARQFVAFCRGRAWVFTEVGSTAHGDALFTFTHRTFLEYFAAAHLASTSDTPEQLCTVLMPHIAEAEWEVVAQLAIQIKSRTTADGGPRFVEATLSTVDGHQHPQTANLLGFLGRLVHLVDVPPSLLRRLTGRAFAEIMSHPEAENSHGGLSRLMALGRAADRDIVRTRVIELLNEGFESHDRQRRRLALLWTTYMVSTLTSRVGFEQTDPEVHAYWMSTRHELIAAHRDALAEMAIEDGAVPAPLLYTPGFDVLPLLLRLGSLDTLFADVPTGFLGSWVNPFRLILADIRLDAYADPELMALLGAIATACLALGSPPWASAQANPPIYDHRTVRPRRTAEAPVGDALAGVCLVMAFSHEIATHDTEPVFRPYTGVAAVFNDYLEARSTGVREVLPPLPVRAEFQELFNAWAAREADFLRVTSPQP